MAGVAGRVGTATAHPAQCNSTGTRLKAGVPLSGSLNAITMGAIEHDTGLTPQQFRELL